MAQASLQRAPKSEILPYISWDDIQDFWSNRNLFLYCIKKINDKSYLILGQEFSYDRIIITEEFPK